MEAFTIMKEQIIESINKNGELNEDQLGQLKGFMDRSFKHKFEHMEKRMEQFSKVVEETSAKNKEFEDRIV